MNCNIAATLQRIKEYIKSKKVFAAVSLISSIIGIFVFLTGIQSGPDVLKKLWYDSSEDSIPLPSSSYTVKLLLPAKMSGAEIWVDSQPAAVVQQTPTVVTVEVEPKTTGHQFTVRKGEEICSQSSQLIQENNVIVHPCQ